MITHQAENKNLYKKHSIEKVTISEESGEVFRNTEKNDLEILEENSQEFIMSQVTPYWERILLS